MAKKRPAKRKPAKRRQHPTAAPEASRAAPGPGSGSLIAIREPPVPELADDELGFSPLELEFFRRGEELERMLASPEDGAWDWGAETATARSRVA